MGRSVSTHRNAYTTVYLRPQISEDLAEEEAGFSDFEDLLQLLSSVIMEKYPSFDPCDRWEGRENRIILENLAAEVSVSEYNGLVAVCLAPREYGYSEAEDNRYRNWTRMIAPHFEKQVGSWFAHCALLPLGRASNGEQFFRPVNRPEGIVTSKEGELW